MEEYDCKRKERFGRIYGSIPDRKSHYMIPSLDPLGKFNLVQILWCQWCQVCGWVWHHHFGVPYRVLVFPIGVWHHKICTGNSEKS